MLSGASPPARSALVIDDDDDFRSSLALLVSREGLEVREAGTLATARTELKQRPPDVVFVDLQLPDGSGLDLMMELDGPARPDFVVITGNATVDTAVDALRQGALDFLVKPVDRERLRAILSNVVRTRQLRGQVDRLRDELKDLGRFGPMVGRSEPMRRIYELVSRVAPTQANVLIRGESGTGKELVAETVHQLSSRASKPFLAVNCGAVAPNVIESELFGHEKGSFTGADRSRKGYFEEVSGGTLFFDEITEMAPDLQVKLLRVLESGTFLRVGASEATRTDVRILAATNRDPEKAVAEGKFRGDLYYRLNVFPIEVPPLRERGEDIALLAAYFLDLFNRREGTGKSWSAAALKSLRYYSWPGNVRELRNVVERTAIMSGETLEVDALALPETGAAPGPPGRAIEVEVGSRLEDAERKLILATLRQTGGDKKKATQLLGISLKTLYNRLNVYQAGGATEAEGAGQE